MTGPKHFSLCLELLTNMARASCVMRVLEVSTLVREEQGRRWERPESVRPRHPEMSRLASCSLLEASPRPSMARPPSVTFQQLVRESWLSWRGIGVRREPQLELGLVRLGPAAGTG